MAMKFQSGNSVAAINVTAPGSGFTARPTATVAAAPAGGVTALATAVGIVVTATVQNGGVDYEPGDILSVAGGVGGAATIRVVSVLSAGEIDEIEIVNPGAYTTLPSLSANAVTGGAGENATINLVIGCGPVTVTNPGAGYVTVPAVTIGGTGGSGATAVAVLADTRYAVRAQRTAMVRTTRTLSRRMIDGLVAQQRVWGE